MARLPQLQKATLELTRMNAAAEQKRIIFQITQVERYTADQLTHFFVLQF